MEKKLEIFYQSIDEFLQMDIYGIIVNCPYWANHLKNGKVVEHGFEEGKGKVLRIKQEIRRLVDLDRNKEPKKKWNKDNITYLARQNRVGIDCSGFVFRVIENILEKKDLEEMFPLGVNRTNADMLTHNPFSSRIDSVKEIRIGDFIRMNSGHHIVVITHISSTKIEYVHSSSRTQINGVHIGVINIIRSAESIEKQEWNEMTPRRENWKDSSFQRDAEDGIYRNNILTSQLNSL